MYIFFVMHAHSSVLYWGPSILALLGEADALMNLKLKNALLHKPVESLVSAPCKICCCVRVGLEGCKWCHTYFMTSFDSSQGSGQMNFGLHLPALGVFLQIRPAGANQIGRWQRYEMSPPSLPSQRFGSTGQLSWISQSNNLYEIRVQLWALSPSFLVWLC